MRRRVLSIQRAARSKYFRSAHQQVLSGKQTIEKTKQNKKNPPLLHPRIESLSTYICLLIERKLGLEWQREMREDGIRRQRHE